MHRPIQKLQKFNANVGCAKRLNSVSVNFIMITALKSTFDV